MALSDRGFRALARDEPGTIVRLMQMAVTDMVPAAEVVTPEMVDDPHLDPPPPALEADWIARVGDDELLHVECQGYRDRGFPGGSFAIT